MDYIKAKMRMHARNRKQEFLEGPLDFVVQGVCIIIGSLWLAFNLSSVGRWTLLGLVAVGAYLQRIYRQRRKARLAVDEVANPQELETFA